MLRLAIAWAVVSATAAHAAESWLVEVHETAGIERFGYPLSAEFKTSADADAAFDLYSHGNDVPAQFTRLESSSDGSKTWSVDFALDLGPLETRRLRIVRAEQSDQKQDNRRGLAVEQGDGATIVRHPSLAFVVPNNLKGLFEKIEVSGDDFLVGGATGLVMSLLDGSEVPLVLPAVDGKPPRPRIVKSGPLAVVLRYEDRIELPGGEAVTAGVTLDFPLGKSWVCIDWSLDRLPANVSGIGADVRLRLAPEEKHPVLVDVGANGWTYAVLKPDESLVYFAEPTSATAKNVWSVDRIIGSVATPYALPAESGVSPAPQGWAHLLDASRCTAIAMDQFAAQSRDSIRLSSDGHVQLRRAGCQQPRLKFWLHVVRSPAQIGAATNPLSMQLPPEVRIVPWQAAATAGE